MAEPANSARRPEKDEIDPELVALRRPTKGIGPILGLSVLVLSGYLIVTQLPDLRYALSTKSPTHITDAAQRPPTQAIGSYVTLHATLDHATTVRLRGKQDTGARLVAARGTGGRLWIQVEGEPGNVTPVYDDSYTGRLVRLADLAHADAVRAYVATKLAPQPRYVFPESIGNALPSVDVAGDPLHANAETQVGVDQRIRDHALVTLVATDDVKTQGDAAAILVGAGLIDANAAPIEASGRAWTWDVSHAGGIDAIRGALVERGLQHKTLVAPRVERHTGTWKGLAVSTSAVTLDGKQIPIPEIERLAVFSRPIVPDDALVLVEGEEPGRYWYLPPLYGLLAIVALAMIWATIRGLRGETRADPAREGGGQGSPPS